MKVYIAFSLFILLFAGCSIKKQQLQNQNFTADFSTSLDQDWTIETHTFANNLAHFSEKNIQQTEGNLVLSLTADKTHDKEYAGAEIRTKKKFLYGRFETRLKATDALGCITAFFLYNPDGKINHEIDFEISGKFPKTITLNHWISKKSHDKDIELQFDTTKDFHDYAIIWQPNKLEWEIDGKIIYSTIEAVPNKPMHVIFNLWATKSVKWAGTINDEQLPAKAYIKFFNFAPYNNK